MAWGQEQTSEQIIEGPFKALMIDKKGFKTMTEIPLQIHVRLQEPVARRLQQWVDIHSETKVDAINEALDSFLPSMDELIKLAEEVGYLRRARRNVADGRRISESISD